MDESAALATAGPSAAATDRVPSHADVDADLRRLGTLVAGQERRTFELVEVVDRIARSGLVEELEGLPVEELLGLRFRLTRGQVWMLQTAGECLRDMPATKRLWRSGVISWSQVRQIVDGAKRLPRQARKVLDGRLAASEELLDALDPDRLAWAVDREVDELCGARPVRDAERRGEQSAFISVQPDFDGGGSFYGQMDAVGLSTVVDAWDAAADDLAATGTNVPAQTGRRRAVGAMAAASDYLAGHPATHTDHHHDRHDDGGHDDGDARGGNADGDEHDPGVDRNDGGGGGGGGRRPRRARPLVNLVVDVADCTTTAAGQVLLNTSGALPTITRTRLQQILETDHDCRVVLFDHGRPLAVSDLVHASDVPTKTKIAVRVRDRGGRMPGSRTPAADTHIHHLDKERYGHHPDQLVALGAFAHLRQVHRRGWELALDPATARITATWHDRTYHSLPWGTRLRRAPDEDDDHDGHD